MLSTLLRIFSAALVVGVTACSFGSTPVGQDSSNSTASKRKDGGTADESTTTRRRVSTQKADARVEVKDEDAGAGDSGDSDNSKRDAGDGRKASGGTSGSGTKPVDNGGDKKPNTNTNQEPKDAGTHTPPATDAGAQPVDAGKDAGDPIRNLEELSKMTPSARITATTQKFLKTLSEGEAPASSIKEFLTGINDEVDCKMNPLAYECITACQAVGTTCALCILEDECRMTMLDICGVTALGGCIPRR
jgi:hypothetical protein